MTGSLLTQRTVAEMPDPSPGHGAGVETDLRRSRLSAMAKPHTRELGTKIAADYRLLNYLRGRSTETVDKIGAGSTRIDVEGGVLASRCEEDHEEVLECWYFYKRAGKPN